jgi:hypothetical protein
MKLLYLSEGEAIKFKDWKEVVKNQKNWDDWKTDDFKAILRFAFVSCSSLT